jgi:hypothetical protein
MGQLWAFIKLAPKIGALIKIARPVAEAILKGKAPLEGGTDERLKVHLAELKIAKLESSLAGMEKTLKRLVAAIYLVAGVAVAALILAVVKLA